MPVPLASVMMLPPPDKVRVVGSIDTVPVVDSRRPVLLTTLVFSFILPVLSRADELAVVIEPEVPVALTVTAPLTVWFARLFVVPIATVPVVAVRVVVPLELVRLPAPVIVNPLAPVTEIVPAVMEPPLLSAGVETVNVPLPVSPAPPVTLT